MTKKKTEYEEITVKVPKALMQLIRDQNYFSRTPEKFLTDCVKRGVDCELNALPFDEMNRLERKYKVKAELVVYPGKVTL